MISRITLTIISIIFFSMPFYFSVEANSSIYIEFDVPQYTVTESENYDYVDISGGDIILGEEGRPRIPYYLYSVDYEKSYRIQDVLMSERSEPEVEIGLNLPVIIQQWTITKSVEIIIGWYPDIDFEWNQIQNPDGSNTLNIIVYPVKYNPQTKELLFYRHYEFTVDYILSEVEILSVSTDKPSYLCGETVDINTEIINTGNAGDLYLDIIIRLYGSGNYVDSLAIRRLNNVTGNCSFSARWDSSDIEAGNYYAEIILTDIDGNIIAGKNADFALSDLSPTTTIQADSTSTMDNKSLLDLLKDSVIWIVGIVIAIVLVVIIIILGKKSIH